MAEQSRVRNVDVGEDGAAILDKIAERFDVSRVTACRWVLRSIDPVTFLPYAFLDTTVVSEKEPVEGAAI